VTAGYFTGQMQRLRKRVPQLKKSLKICFMDFGKKR